MEHATRVIKRPEELIYDERLRMEYDLKLEQTGMPLRYPSHLQLPGHVRTPEQGTNYFTGPLEASKDKVDFFFFK